MERCRRGRGISFTGGPPPAVPWDTVLVAPLGCGRGSQRDTGRSLPAPPSSSPAPQAAASLLVLEPLLHRGATRPWPCPPHKMDLQEGAWGQPHRRHGARVLGATGCLSPLLWPEALRGAVPMPPALLGCVGAWGMSVSPSQLAVGTEPTLVPCPSCLPSPAAASRTPLGAQDAWGACPCAGVPVSPRCSPGQQLGPCWPQSAATFYRWVFAGGWGGEGGFY